MEINKLECVRCKNLHPETLYAGHDRLCVYCKADDAESIPGPNDGVESTTEEQAEVSVQEKAKAELAKRFLTRKRLLPFVERFNPDYQAGWVHKDICKRLEKFSKDVAEKKSPRLMLFMPPRHGKSTLASVAFPAWHLGRNPSHECISCSYSGSLAMTFSRKVRQLLREESYKSAFDTRLDPDSQSAEAWLTTRGGGYVAAGVGGGITGKGAHILLIDDPVKNRDDAESQNGREANWELVRYPAIAEEDEDYRSTGHALHPERYDTEALDRIRKAVGPRDWSALYQQNPVADDGDYFTRGMIQYYDWEDVDMDQMRYYCAWDLAIGQRDRNDYTVGMVVGVDQWDNLYVVDVIRGRFDGFEIVETILDVYEQWKPSIIGIEKGHIEMALGPFLEKRVRERGLTQAYFKDLKTGRRDKEARARAIQGRMQQGMVYLPKDEVFTGPLVAELLRFPNGVHDDQVDALSWIGLMMAEFSSYVDTVEHAPSWRDRLDHLSKSDRSKSAMSA